MGEILAQSSREEFQTKPVFIHIKKLHFLSLIFNLLLRKSQGACVWDCSMEDIIFSFSEDCVKAWDETVD